MSAELVFVLLGGALLLAALLPQLLHRYALSAPIVLIATGMAIGLIPAADAVRLDPVAARPWIEHLTEVTVLVALMGVGLALDVCIDGLLVPAVNGKIVGNVGVEPDRSESAVGVRPELDRFGRAVGHAAAVGIDLLGIT